MLVVKLGGSVITRKGRLRSFDAATTRRLAREIATAREPVLLVHGAGSFGHVLAKRHRLDQGLRDKRQLAGLARVHRDVRVLHSRVLASVQDAGLAAVGVPPLGVAERLGGGILRIAQEPFRWALGAGLTPVTFGDVISDAERGASILSGDTLLETLAADLGATRAIFALDVDGLLAPAPGPGATLVRSLSPEQALVARTSAARVADVTGGLSGKLAAAGRLARKGVPVLLVNGRKRGRVAAAVQGRAVEGTLVK
ncbi:MAG: isopentenyl phosphate kinase [Methanobacteriota archaeon]